MDLLEAGEFVLRYIVLPLIGAIGIWVRALKKEIEELKNANHVIQLAMTEKLDREEAATMISNATSGIDRKLDKIYDWILENKK